jgi:ribose/xylose/arabinose/galactoside ABC-type transport system permease subunit
MEHRATHDASWIRRVQQGLAAMPGAFFLLAGMVIALSIGTPGFLTRTNLTNVALQVAVLTILALGMTLVILTEGVDLSLGPVLGLCGVCAALVAVSGRGLAIAIPVALLVGAACGLVNGLLIAAAGLPSFIVTLGMFGIAPRSTPRDSPRSAAASSSRTSGPTGRRVSGARRCASAARLNAT